MGGLGRYVGAGSGVVGFWLMLPMCRWVPMSGGHILIVDWPIVWMWSWFMVGVLDRMLVGRFNRMMVSRFNRVMVGRFNRVMVGRFDRVMVGRRPNGSCRFAMVGPGGCLCVQHLFGKWGGVAHTIAVSEVPIIPFSLHSATHV